MNEIEFESEYSEDNREDKNKPHFKCNLEFKKNAIIEFINVSISSVIK